MRFGLKYWKSMIDLRGSDSVPRNQSFVETRVILILAHGLIRCSRVRQCAAYWRGWLGPALPNPAGVLHRLLQVLLHRDHETAPQSRRPLEGIGLETDLQRSMPSTPRAKLVSKHWAQPLQKFSGRDVMDPSAKGKHDCFPGMTW